MTQQPADGELFNLTLGISGKQRRERSDKVAERLARRILRDIVNRNLAPGAKLPPEAIMLQSYEVGRASLREGLRILEVYGLIWIKPGPNGGPVVADVSSVDFARGATFFYQTMGATLHELVESRVFVEPLMARLAAERLTDEGAASLQHALKMERESLDGLAASGTSGGVRAEDPTEWWPTLFHKIVASLSGNRVMSLFGQAIVDIYVERISLVARGDRREHVHTTHKAIGAAILKGQNQKAERLMRVHMEDLANLFTDHFPGLADEIIDWR